MSFDPIRVQHLGALKDRLSRAQIITPDLVSDVIDGACLRLAQHPAAAARVHRLIDSAAFVDVALAVIELELPAWKLRRLCHDHGEWHCSLSKQLALPAELDAMAEAGHEILPVAILSAFVEARRVASAASEFRPKIVPQVRPAHGLVACCDNFR